MPKEKLCDCGKPISQCECEGHNHKKAKNVKKGGVPDYLSIFGDRVQQYADYKRKKQEQYTPRSLYDPFGIVVDIGDDGGLSGTASFYKPGKSRGTAMTKKAKVQMCEECGKPEFACKCKGHQGGRSMSKAMCKCGSGMSKAMCKCGGMGKNMHKSSSTPDYINYLQGTKSKGMMGRVSTDAGSRGITGTRGTDTAWADPNSGAGTHRNSFVNFNTQGTTGMKKGGNNAMMCKCGSGMSKAACKCGAKGKQMAKRRGFPPVPPPSPIPNVGDGIKGTIMTFSGKMPGKIKDMLGLGDMFTPFKSLPMKLFSRMGKRGNISKTSIRPGPIPDPYRDVIQGVNPFQGIKQLYDSYQTGNLFANTPDYVNYSRSRNPSERKMFGRNQLPALPHDPLEDFVDKNIMDLPSVNMRDLIDSYNQGNYNAKDFDYINYLHPNSGKMNKREKQRPDEYGHSPEKGHNPAENAVRQSMPTSYDTARYRLQMFDDKKKKQIESLFKMPLSEIPKKYLEMLSEAIKEAPEQHKVMFDMMGGSLKRPREITAKNPLEQLKEHYGMDKPSSKKGKKVNKAWPLKPTVPRGTLKRLSKSMKMDADMGKAPQKVTPKRTIRHTDKYFK